MVNIPLPKNPWLRRRRQSGMKYEVERLFARCRDIYFKNDHLEAQKQILTFLSSEYKRNEVYYAFIRMCGLRRVSWYIQQRLKKEAVNVGHPHASR